MIREEYYRYLRSTYTFVLLSILVLIGVASYYMSYMEKNTFINQLNSNSDDLNYQTLNLIIENYSGMQFFTNFLYSDDFYQIFIIVLFAGLGIFLGYIHYDYKEKGLGTLIITRSNFSKYIRTICIAQTFYITTLIFIVMSILFVLAFIAGGLKFTYGGIGEYNLSFVQGSLIALSHIIMLMFYTILVSLITLLTPVFIHNKYLIQVFPVITFIIAPIIMGSTIANLTPILGRIIYSFIPFITLNIIPTLLTTDIPVQSILVSIVPFLLLLFSFYLLYRLNIRKYSEDYL